MISRTGLFSPYNFSLNNFIPSLGHLFLLSILASILGYIFFAYFPFSRFKKQPVGDYLVIVLTIGFSALLISLINNTFAKLITDSNINFETYKVLKLNFYSIAGFLSIILLLLVPVFLLLKVSILFKDSHGNVRIISSIISLFIIAAFLNGDLLSFAVVSILFICIIVLLWYAIKINLSHFNITVIFSFLFSIYSLCIISVFSEIKTNENLKVQSFAFSTDNDPVAEHLLLDLWPKLSVDKELDSMMSV